VDHELVSLAQQGDRAAFERVALEISDELFAIASGLLRDRDAAADAFQVALVRIWRDLPSLRDRDRFPAWARRVLVNCCYQAIRARRRSPVTVAISPIDSIAADSERALGTRDELERAFSRLSPEHRAVVLLHYYRDLPIDEIADNLGIALGTVKSRLHHARRALRAAIEADARPARQEGPAA
jgi:RNA polymerase sigma-70 factor (ECF subfamily)